MISDSTEDNNKLAEWSKAIQNMKSSTKKELRAYEKVSNRNLKFPFKVRAPEPTNMKTQYQNF